MSVARVVSLNCFPIKSCGGIKLGEAPVTEHGFSYDRHWMLVGDTGLYVSQRTHPELALVGTEIDGNFLHITAPELGSVALSLERDSSAEQLSVKLREDSPGIGTVERADSSEFFSDYLKKPVRLVRLQEPRVSSAACRVDGVSNSMAFMDVSPLTATVVESLEALNRQLPNPMHMDAFRANIVIEGVPAYDEDHWRELQIGDQCLFVLQAIRRCPIPNIDQKVGVLDRTALTVSRALSETRGGTDTIDDRWGKFFGQNLAPVYGPGWVVKIGDSVTVARRSDQPNWRPKAS